MHFVKVDNFVTVLAAGLNNETECKKPTTKTACGVHYVL